MLGCNDEIKITKTNKMKKSFYLIIGIAGLFFLFTSEVLYHTGSPGGKTGSPGDGGATCTQCHGGSATFQEGWITSDIPVDGYMPGETYTITATGTHAGVGRFGFELTSEDATNTKVGTIMVTNATETQLVNGNNSITHTNSGFTPNGDMKSWSFDWTAPAEGTGEVTFYAAFNAANGNGNNQGDVIYRSEYAVSEANPTVDGLMVNLSGMDPHVGQLLEARLINKANMMEVDRLAIDPVPSADFEIHFENIMEGENYWIDMYADFNENGYYDGTPTDHAWRLSFNNAMNGDMQDFIHNTNFDEINWKHMYMLEFEDMDPHIGQKLEVRLVDQSDMMEAGRTTIEEIMSAEFDVMLPYLQSGHDYYVDFYADLNQNGVYDDPPTDHAWRIELMDTEGDEDDTFMHNTDFTDISWNYRFTLHAMEMTPHLGQMFEMRVVNMSTMEEVGRMSMDSVVVEDFHAMTTGLGLGADYYIDFYADHNGNGMYDAPPVDHAWRLELSSVDGDSELDFTHNTDFTDIEWPTVGIEDNLASQVNVYPNPVRDFIHISTGTLESSVSNILIYNSNGNLIETAEQQTGTNPIKFGQAQPGTYFMQFELENGKSFTKRIIKL